MKATIEKEPVDQYARTIAASKRVRWYIDEDVIRNRTFDMTPELCTQSP
jgi:hypothetical protein